VTARPQVLIVGAGFSGIGVAAGLRKAGIEDFMIVDDGDAYGGTWNWNRYPGVAVDIPSFSYQYSFAKRTSWSRVYAPGAELRDYAEHCAERFGLGSRTQFNTHVSAASFDEDAHTWHLKTDEGESIDARYVIDASGVLTVPKMPDIDGLETFAGATLHTSRWDQSQDLRGKRVAVIGTGASAVQVIPAIASEVEHLTVFQRTPIWCLPKLDAPLPTPIHWILERLPGGPSALRALSQTFVELAFPLAAHYHGTLPVASWFENSARSYLRQQVKDPELRDRLTPSYALGCKRPSFHNEYLATFNRANVTLETDPIARITEQGIETAAGIEHPVDVLVLATGFKVFDPGNVPKYPVTGRDGLDLDRFWAENRFQSYEGRVGARVPQLLLDVRPLRLQRLLVLQPDRGLSAPHRPAAQASARARRDDDRDPPRGQRPLLRRDAAPAQGPGVLAGQLRTRQQLLLRSPRGRAATRGADARDDVAKPPLPARRLPVREPRGRRRARRGDRRRLARLDSRYARPVPAAEPRERPADGRVRPGDKTSVLRG